MAHNASLIQMGSSQSSAKEVENRAGAIAAGLVVRLKSDNTISIAAADGEAIGVSLGRSLSDTSRTAIVKKGLKVPVLLTNGFTPTIGAKVAISETTGKAKAYTGTGDAYIDAVYVSGALSAVDEDGAAITDGCALIDFPGGM